jgi:hypothetical protein
MTDDTIKLLQRMADGDVRLTVGAVGAALAEIKRLKDAALYPPWLADAAEALGEVRPGDGAPLALNWTQVIAAIGDLRDDRDELKKRAESAEYALAPYLCQECRTCLSPKEIGHTMCRKCAEKDMAKRLGAGLLDLPADWYDHTPDRGPQ